MKKYIFIFFLFTQCMGNKYPIFPKENLDCNFQLSQGAIYYSLVPYKFRLANIDTSNFIIISKNINFNESKTYFNIQCNSQETKGFIKIYKKREINKTCAKPIINIPYIGIRPPLKVLFGKYKSGSIISFNEFVNGFLSISIDNSDIDRSLQIKSFTLVMQNHDSVISLPTKLDSMFYTNENYGNYTFFNKEQLSQIHKFKPDQLVIIKDIIVKFDKPQEIDPVFFIIKRIN